MTYTMNRSLDEKYEIIREIKKGGFGIVYYGRDKKLNKPVAIKEIAPNLLDDAKYLDMFQEEALNIAKLSHNNIVHIYELKKSQDDHLFIIMEYIDGIDLEKVIRYCQKLDKKIPHHLAVFIVAEICMALDYAHQRRDAFTNKPLNLVHQDVSPSNIMISRFGGVKLIDFGIATVRRHRKDRKDNKLRGKIPYMAPEQLIMGNHADHRSDLFSLGLVLYELLTSDRLFATQEEIIAAGKNPKWFKKVFKGKKIPTQLVNILNKTMEVDLTKRYQTANHMYIDLLQYLISCNETGELMDDLAAFISGMFVSPPSLTPTHFSTPGDFTDLTQSPLSGSESSFISEAWNTETTGKTSRGLSPADVPSSRSRRQNKMPQPVADVSPLPVDGEGEDDLKTVIDVIRISARNHKKRILQVCAGIMATLLTLGVLDTINGWTGAGVWMYDFLFPPAIEIMSVPLNARIRLDDLEVQGRTPLSIEKIKPGVHKLELLLEGYKPIVKSLFVPRDGAIRVQGDGTNGAERAYVFRFTTEVDIRSQPENAQVFINGVRYNQRTPCRISWEIGMPLAIELAKPGFEQLSGYSLNTLDGFDEVEDRRFWSMKVYNDTYKRYGVTGLFRKKVLIETIPPGAGIYDAPTNEKIGVTGGGSTVVLTAGTHVLELRKGNFIPQKLTLNIDGSFKGKVRTVLSRRVTFSAVDDNKREIAAVLVSLKTNNREYLRNSRTTPTELALPATTYTAIFAKPGYERAQARIRPGDRAVRVQMKQMKSKLEVAVFDAFTNLPITGAEIFYNFTERPRTLDILLDKTNPEGEGAGELAAGSYIFKVRRVGYNVLSRSVDMQPGETHNLVFRIFPSN